MLSRRIVVLLLLGLPLAGCSQVSTGISGSNSVSVSTTGDSVTRITVNGQTVELKEREKDVVREAFKTGAAPRVVVEVFAGKIAVEAGAEGAVEAEVTRVAAGETKEEAKANLKLIDVQMKQDGDAIRVTARGPDAAGQDFESLKKKFSARSADAVVKVPAGASLVLKTAFGDVQVSKIAGRVEAESSSGTVSVTGGKGELKLTSSFGNLNVNGPNTTVNAATNSGAVTVKGAKGPLDLSSDFGGVTVEGATEKLAARSKSGNVMVSGAKAEVTATSGFGSVTVDGAEAVRAETKSGGVTVKRATGAVTAKSGFGPVDVEGAPAGATLESSSGNVRLRGGQGAVVLTSNFGSIDAEVAGATVKATSKSGGVSVKGALADGESSLHSGFGKVTLTLPADSRFRLDAATKFGQVTTAFPLTKTDEKGKSRLRGVVGDDPKTTLKLTADSGDVEVRKE